MTEWVIAAQFVAYGVLITYFFIYRRMKNRIVARLLSMFPNGLATGSTFSNDIFEMRLGDFECDLHWESNDRHHAGSTVLAIRVPDISSCHISMASAFGLFNFDASDLGEAAFVHKVEVQVGDEALYAFLHRRDVWEALRQLFSIRRGEVQCQQYRERFGQPGAAYFKVSVECQLRAPGEIERFIRCGCTLFQAYLATVSRHLPQWKDKRFSEGIPSLCDELRPRRRWVNDCFDSPEVAAFLNEKYPLAEAQSFDSGDDGREGEGDSWHIPEWPVWMDES